MKRLIFSAAFVLLTLTTSIGFAKAANEQFIFGGVDRKYVEATIQYVNPLFLKAILSDGSHPGPITQIEKRKGVIPITAAHLIANLAFDTALADWCGLDWKELSYLQIMRRERAREIWKDRQFTYIAVLHGAFQIFFKKMLQEFPSCTERLKRQVENFLSKKQWQSYSQDVS